MQWKVGDGAATSLGVHIPVEERRLVKVTNDVSDSAESVEFKVGHVLFVLLHTRIDELGLGFKISQLVSVACDGSKAQ